MIVFVTIVLLGLCSWVWSLPLETKGHLAERNLMQYEFELYKDQCTSIGVGKLASIDGSTMTTHNNDCQECDFRITHVKARDWPEGSKRPINDIRTYYPRYASKDPNNVHGHDYLIEHIDRSIYNWTESIQMATIDQVPHTFAYTLGTYGIQNEKQLSIGESTCSSVFVGKPVSVGGKAIMHMEPLTEIAMERCATARCAITTMGSLAEKYGFYGPEHSGPFEVAQDEAGESLTISDPDEVWVFHILPDSTGASAIWVAQRVPDDHISAVANQFVIGEINVNDKENFIASSNIFSEAESAGLWSSTSGVPFHFSRIYGTDRHAQGYACTRRVWRVFTLAAPSLLSQFSPYSNGLATFGYGFQGTEAYPFSIKPDKLLTPQDIMNINRDQYENSPFDMTKGVDGGPFGDPMRFSPRSAVKDPENGITKEEYRQGLGFQRAISLWRTAYSTVTQSRKHLPDELGAVTWIAPYAPHFSTFVPVYASAPSAPSSLKTGTQYKFDRNSNWWIHCLTGNYLSRWYTYTASDIQDLQRNQQQELQSSVNQLEARLLSDIQRRQTLSLKENADGKVTSEASLETIKKNLADFHDHAATSIRDAWTDFFFEMAGKYRDVYKIVNPHAENFNEAYSYLSIPRWWFEQIGYWGAPSTPVPGKSEPMPIRPINIPSMESSELYAERYPNGMDDYSYTWPYQQASKTDGIDTNAASASSPSMMAIMGYILLGMLLGFGLFLLKDKIFPRHQYMPLN